MLIKINFLIIFLIFLIVNQHWIVESKLSSKVSLKILKKDGDAFIDTIVRSEFGSDTLTLSTSTNILYTIDIGSIKSLTTPITPSKVDSTILFNGMTEILAIGSGPLKRAVALSNNKVSLSDQESLLSATVYTPVGQGLWNFVKWFANDQKILSTSFDGNMMLNLYNVDLVNGITGQPTTYDSLMDDVSIMLWDDSNKLLILSNQDEIVSIKNIAVNVDSKSNQNLLTRYTAVLGGNNKMYICSGDSNGIYLEVLPYQSSGTFDALVSPVLIDDSVTSGRCLNAAYEPSSGLIFFTVKSNSGQLGVVYVKEQGLISKVDWLEGYQAGDVNPSSHSLMVDDQRVYIVTQNEIAVFSYSKTCPNNCSSHGTCVNLVCQCNNGYGTEDCSKATPTITSVSGIGYQSALGESVTIKGTGFYLSTNYTISIANSECTDLKLISATSISCKLQVEGSDLDPYQSYDISLIFDGLVASGVKLFKLKSPTVTKVSQGKDQLSIQGDNFYDSSKMVLKLGNEDLTSKCNFDSKLITCQLPDEISSGLVLKLTDTNSPTPNIIYSQAQAIAPFLDALSTTTFTTKPMTVTIFGKYFKSVAGATSVTVIEGGNSTVVTGGNVLSDMVIYTTLNVLNPTLQLSVKTTAGQSNSLNYTYVAPQIDKVEQLEKPSNSLNVFGSNFGSKFQLVHVTINGLACTVNSADHEIMNIALHPNAQPGNLSVEILSKFASTNINLKPKITEVKPLPDTKNSNITIIGEYLANSTIYLKRNNETSTLPCTSSELNYPNGSTICTFVNGTGRFEIYSVSDQPDTAQLQSPNFQSNYHGPIVTKVEPNIYTFGNAVIFTMSGRNFANVSMSVLVATEECLVQNITDSQIVCSLTPKIDPDSVENPVLIKITVDSIEGGDQSLLIYEKTCKKECLNQGKCSSATGLCECTDEFMGDDCSKLRPTTGDSSISDDPSSSNQLPYISYWLFISVIISVIYS
ncbi:5'-nucleotidase [Tieghemostelium lacteum]|uniref:5'-nucleotidase n=1 Tax=Tieghemostelium lacteum TaxID=361077 RepID=A0A151ZHS3_TIELA|nr:5'-nucleotidase [Tieghemostelium lacteum]|eukprot:KYQ93465.1 5'-nucleotidase [Tieghemostelium lacteum]